MVKIKIFVEGGGNDNPLLKTECRKGFVQFLEKAGFAGRMPQIIACGSRNQAFDKFCIAVKTDQKAFLLVDSESAVDETDQQGEPSQWKPWSHFQKREGDQHWEKPKNAEDKDCHLMVECMESWFLADREALKKYFGQGFNEKTLPGEMKVEKISKSKVLDALKNATRPCKTKCEYAKGEHSFKLLEKICPEKVFEASPWAKRLIDALNEMMQ